MKKLAVESREGFIVFSDLKGFSKLTPNEQENYLVLHVHLLSKTIKPLLEKAFVYNTWGDAIVAVFKDGMQAAEFMLAYRMETKDMMYMVAKDKKVIPRISGHYGTINVFLDPLLERENTISDEVNTAARIEPVTRAGEIFVSIEFKEAFLQKVTDKHKVKFEPLGMMPLAKGYGEKELFRLIGGSERTHIIDKIFNLDLPQALPVELELQESERQIIESLKGMSNRVQINAILEKEWIEIHSGIFAWKIAEICKKAGLYKEGVQWIEKAQAECIMTGGIPLFPYKTKKDIIKLKADLLTRLDLYNESAEILYSLWKNIEGENTKDASEILAMLAAQFKRRAIIKNNQILTIDEIDKEMVKKAASLYLEAFRYDIDNYYPAINAAYLLVMLGGKEASRGKKLAIYIKDTWGNELGSSHWLDFTLAETEIVQGDYEEALEGMEYALKTHINKIGIFDIESTKIQITQFFTIMDEEDGQEILDLLERYIELKKGESYHISNNT